MYAGKRRFRIMRHLKYRSIYPVLLVPLLSSLLVVAVLLLHVFPFPFTHASSVSGRVTLPSSVAAYASKSRVLSRAAGGQSLSLAVGLKLRNETDLDSYLQQITSPQSPLYRHYLNVATFKALYAPLPSSEAAVRSFLQSQGFTVTRTYANHLVVDVKVSIILSSIAVYRWVAVSGHNMWLPIRIQLRLLSIRMPPLLVRSQVPQRFLPRIRLSRLPRPITLRNCIKGRWVRDRQ